MRWLTKMWMRVRMLFRRGDASAQLREELEFHLDRQVAENRAAGMTAEEARKAALRSFGNPALVRDHTHATWSWGGMEALWRDLRYGVRALWRTPGFSVIAIGVIALGIGANVALFTVVRSVLLRPLPFNDPNRLMELYEHGIPDNDVRFAFNVVSPGMYSEWKKQNHSFSSIALIKEDQVGLAGAGGQLPENIEGSKCSWDLFGVLGVQPMLGRTFTAGDDSLSANGTVILSASLFKRRFGSDPTIVNHTIYLDAKPYSVIGIMPAWFAFPAPTTQLWRPIYHEFPANIMEMIDNHMFNVVGRLKPGTTPASAVADLNSISLRIHNAHLDNPFVSRSANVRPLLEHMVGDLKKPLYVLLCATFCVLLIACLNVANLLVARAASRRRELAIRTALGGGWARLLRERLIESLLLSLAGGATGLDLAWGALSWLVKARDQMSRIDAIRIDGVVASFTIGVIVVCALFSGLISAFSAGEKRVLGALHESSRSVSSGHARARLRKALLALEVGLTMVLLVGAGLLVKSYQRLRSADMGCATENVLTMRFGLPGVRYKTPGPAPVNFFDALLTRIRALPGVDAAGLVEAVPGQGYWEDSSFEIVGHPPLPQGQGQYALNRDADPGYFAAMGIPILHGRTFNAGQRLDKANEIILSESFVKRYFNAGEEPLGKQVHTEGKDFTVVGIVGDTRYEIGEDPDPMKYLSVWRGGENYGTLVVRSRGDVELLAMPVQRVIASMDHDLAVSDVLTMNQLLGKSMVDETFNATLLAGFAALSLLLAAAGIFGVLSYIVAQRTGEIGIRMALGAQREQMLWKVLLDGLRPALFGLVIGLGASLEAARLIRLYASSILYKTEPLDPSVFAAVAATLIAVAAVACIIPAWRASRVDPIEALRTE